MPSSIDAGAAVHSQSLSEQQFAIPTPSGTADAWVFHPRKGKWPAVILHTDIKGVRPAFIESGRRLAALGYVVLLPNLYHRVGPAPVIDPALSPRDEATKPQFDRLRASLTREAVRQDHAALLDFLAAQTNVSGTRVGIVGYCMSGAIALHAAADFSDRIAAVASFHGGRLATDAADSPHLRAGELRGARLYFGYARDDASMPEDAIERLEASLREAGVYFAAERYAGKHGYAVSDNAAFDPASAEQHWQALARLLRRALGEGKTTRQAVA